MDLMFKVKLLNFSVLCLGLLFHVIAFWRERPTSRFIIQTVNFLVFFVYTIFLSLYALEERNPVFKAFSENFLLLAWTLCFLFLVVDSFSPRRSLGLFLFPLVFFIALLGMLALANPYREELFYREAYLGSQVRAFLVLLTYVMYCYAFIIALVFRALFLELRYKGDDSGTLFFAKRLPPISQLEKQITFFIAAGLLLYLAALSLGLFLPFEGSFFSLGRNWFSLGAWGIFCLVLVLRLSKRLDSKRRLQWMGAAFVFILLSLVTF